MGIETQMELRGELIDYLQHMQPGTPIAIFQIDTEMRLIQGFSADPQVLLAAAKSKRNMPSLLRPLTGPGTQLRRNRPGLLSDGFEMMGRYLAGFPGRKNLVWFTGSAPDSFSFDRSFKDDFQVLDSIHGDPVHSGPIDALTLSRVAVYPIDARGIQTPPQFQAANNGGFSAAADQGFAMAQVQHFDLDTIAEATGGNAYYNTNGLRQKLAQIVSNGSNYYTITYATTNKTWDGQFRHIKVTVDRPGVKLQTKPGYFAVDRAKQEQRLLAAMQKRKAHTSKDPFGEEDASSENESESEPPAPGSPAAPTGAGVLVHHAKGSFDASMQLGVAPPTEVVLTASLAEDTRVVKLHKKAPLPPDNYLEADYKTKPFRTYTVHIKADAQALHLAQAANGMRHGSVEFATLVYDQSGTRVNSALTTAVLNVNEAHYRRLLQGGLTAQQQIAVPAKGSYFLRVGVHDVASDHIGAVEIPVDQVRPGVAIDVSQKP